MITLCQADAVRRLLERPVRDPSSITSVSISSPFVDAYGLALLGRLDLARGKFGLHLVTRPELGGLFASRHWKRLRVVLVSGLHAKVYAVLCVDRRQHEAIVTSTNLTHAGLGSNVELGLRVTGTTPDFARLAERVENWTHRRAPYAAGLPPAGR